MPEQDRRTYRTFDETLRLAIPLMVVWTLGIAVMIAVAAQSEDRAGELLMDPTFSVGSRWYTGLVSNLGILAWTVAASAAFAGAWMCRLGGRQAASRFFLAGGLVGALLLSDDLFQFHAILLPAEIGIPKILGQAALGGALLAWVWTQRDQIRRTHLHLLFAAGAALGASYLIDSVIGPYPGQGWSVMEDGSKFLGVLAWATYFIVTTRDISRSVFRDALMTDPVAAYEEVFGEADEVAPPAAPASAFY